VRWSLILFFAALPVSGADAQLKYAVIVTRHGVRSPTWDAAQLRQYSAEAWPDWGVPAGYLTPHGRAAMLRMGSYYRRWLVSERLLPASGCDAKITVYADNDQRTVESGKALAESLLPGCGVSTGFENRKKEDPLFAESLSGEVKMAFEALRIRLEPSLVAQHRAAFETLESILGSSSFALKGPFAVGSTLAEDLLLEYTNGMQGKDLGWGRLTRENLLQTMEIHTTYEDLMSRTPDLYRANRNFLEHVRKSMEQAVSGRPVNGAIGKPGDVLLVISGHDSNVANLAGLLGLSWKLQGYQPNDTPPGGALIFTLWQDPNGERTVRVRYVAQTPDQMRDLDAGDPQSQDLIVRGCAPCTWAAFERFRRR
jgi:4-phytase/acid phosphatase